MHRTKQIAVVLMIVAVAIVGTFSINGITLQLFEGKTIDSGYLPTLVDSVLYAAWFLAMAAAGAWFLKPRPFTALGIAACGVFCLLVLSGSDWVSPGLSLPQMAAAYLQAHVAKLTVFPAFLLVGYVVQRAASRQSYDRGTPP